MITEGLDRKKGGEGNDKKGQFQVMPGTIFGSRRYSGLPLEVKNVSW